MTYSSDINPFESNGNVTESINDSYYYGTSDNVGNLSNIYNPFTGLGTSDDPKEHYKISDTKILSYSELVALFVGSRICKRLVMTYPLEASWCEINFATQRYKKYSTLSEQCHQYFNSMIDGKGKQTSLEYKFREASIEARLHGVSYILLGIDDEQTFDKPINIDNIKSFNRIEVLDKYSIKPYDPNKPDSDYFNDSVYNNDDYSLPQSLNGLDLIAKSENKKNSTRKTESLDDRYVVKLRKNKFEAKEDKYIIHGSRLIKFVGDWMPHSIHKKYDNMSILQASYDSIVSFLAAMGGASTMLSDHSVLTYGVDGLTAMSKTNNFGIVQDKVLLMRMMKSLIRAIAYDRRTESVEYITRNFGGVDKIIDQVVDYMVAESDLVRYKVLGTSQDKGLGGEGRGKQERLEHSLNIHSWQEFHWKNNIHYCVKLATKAQDGFTNGRDPGSYSINFPPVYELDPLEYAELLEKIQDIGLKAIDNGVLTKYEVRMSVHGHSNKILIPNFTLDERINEQYEREILNNDDPAIGNTDNISGNTIRNSGKRNNNTSVVTTSDMSDNLETEFNFDYIEKINSEWCVFSKSGKKLGCYKTKNGAVKRLRQIEYFKNNDEANKEMNETMNDAENDSDNSSEPESIKFDLNKQERDRVDRYLDNLNIDQDDVDQTLESLK